MIIKRELYNKIEPYIKSKQAIVVTGMRRVGKTFLMKYIFDSISSKNKIYLDLESTLDRKIFQKIDYNDVKFELEAQGINFKEKAYIFIDEIQFLKNIPSVIKYLYDHNNIKFFLTGSSSYYLKNHFSESLVGRKYIFEMFPLTFSEFLAFKDPKMKIPPQNKVSSTMHDLFDQYYEEYVRFGGFPEVVLKVNHDEKYAMLKEVFSSYFQLEIAQLSDFRKNHVIRDLMLLLMERSGSKLDITKIANQLNTSRETINNYIYFLEDTYFISLLRPYSENREVEIRKTPKVYICDSGIVNNLAQVDEGAVFENNIFQNLRLQGELHYYQKISGQEIDFILDKKEAYEVKVYASQSDVNRLNKMSAKLGFKKAYVISKKYCGLNDVIYGFTV